MGQNVKLMHPNEINITIDYDIQRENIHVIILSIKCFSLYVQMFEYTEDNRHHRCQHIY